MTTWLSEVLSGLSYISEFDSGQNPIKTHNQRLIWPSLKNLCLHAEKFEILWKSFVGTKPANTYLYIDRYIGRYKYRWDIDIDIDIDIAIDISALLFATVKRINTS